MQLFSIENLSLAAETTVILLLLAIAWHPIKTGAQPAQNSLEATNWEPAKYFYLQAFIHRGLYLQQWRETQSQNLSQSKDSQPFIPIVVNDDDNRPIMPLPWQDRLTRLLNRQGFDCILMEWLSIGPKHRGDSCLSMVTMRNYSDMVSAHGAMNTEQALQQMAKHLAVASSGESLVARYLPDRFVVLHFASRIASCRKAMEFTQQGMSEEGFFNVAGQPQAIESIVSIVDLHGDSDISSRMDELEEGTIEAERSGRTIYSIAEGSWTDPPSNMVAEEQVNPVETAIVNEHKTAAINQEILKTSAALPKLPAESKTQATVEIHSENEDSEPIASNDISAVANPDDIAALFAQINANKSRHSIETPNPNNLSPKVIEPVEETSTVQPAAAPVAVDISEAASADDIAALFASVKPMVNVNTAPPAKPIGQVDLSKAATADDIASLFATVNSAVKPIESGSDLPSSVPEVKPAEAFDTPRQSTELQTIETSLADSAGSPAVELPSRPVLPSGDQLSEAASLDDIESLFEAMKK